MTNDKTETECDGWVAYGPDGKPIPELFHATDMVMPWRFLSNTKSKAKATWSGDEAYNLHHNTTWLVENGYTVCPVCFVSPSDKRYLEMARKTHREALFEQMREETSE